MPQIKRQTYPVLLDDEMKNAASARTRAKGVPLAVAIRAFLSALIRGDKRAQSIVDEVAKKK